jgi:hypothetical protein
MQNPGRWSNGMTAESHSANRGSIPRRSILISQNTPVFQGYFHSGDALLPIYLSDLVSDLDNLSDLRHNARMKRTLSFDRASGQFKVDLGIPSKRFYLGCNATDARNRKLALVKFWANCELKRKGWDQKTLASAKAIAKGETIWVQPATTTEEQIAAAAEPFDGTGADVRLPYTVANQYQIMLEQALIRNEQLEKFIREKLGNGAVEGPTIGIHAALDAYHEYRKQTEIDVDTGKPSDHVISEGNYCRMLKRLIDDMPLSRLSYVELHRWCKTVAARPLQKKTGKPIKHSTVRNGLKTIRLFVKWASRNYQWNRPAEWHEATLVATRRTADERIEAKQAIAKHYTCDEIGTIWKYARGLDRLLILCGMNFGYAQTEILNMVPGDIAGETTCAIRGKSSVLGVWPVWEETRQYAQCFPNIPSTAQGISNTWNKLIARVQKNEPDFRRLSFKWLRKSGASLVRKIGGGEISSLYLSHGKGSATADELLNVYADTDWEAVSSAVNKLRDQLVPTLCAEVMSGKPHVARSLIDKIRDMWVAGSTYKEICAATGKSRDTVYKYRPQEAGKAV